MSLYWHYKWPAGSLSSLLMSKQILLALMHFCYTDFSTSSREKNNNSFLFESKRNGICGGVSMYQFKRNIEIIKWKLLFIEGQIVFTCRIYHSKLFYINPIFLVRAHLKSLNFLCVSLLLFPYIRTKYNMSNQEIPWLFIECTVINWVQFLTSQQRSIIVIFRSSSLFGLGNSHLYSFAYIVMVCSQAWMGFTIGNTRTINL